LIFLFHGQSWQKVAVICVCSRSNFETFKYSLHIATQRVFLLHTITHQNFIVYYNFKLKYCTLQRFIIYYLAFCLI
jgi:hypothetical protein